MAAPTNLSHKSIVQVENYKAKDAEFANQTDVEFLTIGLAQWDKNKSEIERAISAKVWRYDNNNSKWSRQSEELPIHRVLDLCILLLASIIKDQNIDLPNSNLGETIIDTEKDKFKYVYKYYQKNKKKIDPRVIELERLIKLFYKKEAIKPL